MTEQQDDRGDLNPGPGELIDTREVLIERCKDQGIMLFVRKDEFGRMAFKETGGGEPANPQYRLHRAFNRHDVEYMGHKPAGLTDEKTRLWVTHALRNALNNELWQDDHNSEIRRLSSWPIVRCFVYVDVSDFSKQMPGQQALIINSLAEIVRNFHYWDRTHWSSSWRNLEAMLCIGDGYIFVFASPYDGAIFAARLADTIEVMVAKKRLPVPFHFRMGVHVGAVYCFWDWGRGGRKKDHDGTGRPEQGDWNYIGDGINGGQRVLSVIGKDTDDVVFISGEVREALIAKDYGGELLKPVLGNLVNRGRRQDKHDRPWRVYEVNHSIVGRMDRPSALC